MKLNKDRPLLLALLGHWRWWISYVLIPVWQAKSRYARVLQRVRERYGRKKLKVLFVTGTPAKWECQSLYNLMVKSEWFDPYICQTICDIEKVARTHDERVKHLDACRTYYSGLGMNYVEAYLREREEWIDLNSFNADVIFYNQPWDVDLVQVPHHVAKSALAFQVPYYVPNNEDAEFDVGSPFQRTLFRYCALNKEWADIYNRFLSRIAFAGKILPVGHTELDQYYLNQGKCEQSGYVIYAPHWSIDCPGNENAENYSTFLLSGKLMLEFAKEHPEIKWVFRPHPTLKTVLKRTQVWSDTEIESYYDEWARIGQFSEGGGYEKLFMESRVMITDCGSFLTEYACTGNPIIHLISSTAKLKPMKPSADLYATYYQAHNADELDKFLDEIVLKSLDPNREVRLAKVREAGLLDNYAAQNIMDYLEKLLGGKE